MARRHNRSILKRSKTPNINNPFITESELVKQVIDLSLKEYEDIHTVKGSPKEQARIYDIQTEIQTNYIIELTKQPKMEYVSLEDALDIEIDIDEIDKSDDEIDKSDDEIDTEIDKSDKSDKFKIQP